MRARRRVRPARAAHPQRTLQSVTGFPVVFSVDAAGAVATCVAVTAAAMVIVALVGRRAASVEPETTFSV